MFQKLQLKTAIKEQVICKEVWGINKRYLIEGFVKHWNYMNLRKRNFRCQPTYISKGVPSIRATVENRAWFLVTFRNINSLAIPSSKLRSSYRSNTTLMVRVTLLIQEKALILLYICAWNEFSRFFVIQHRGYKTTLY